MRVLVIKTSSMGDVLHTLPALTDAQTALPGISFDWVVEDCFEEIPSWHPAVESVFPVSFRSWRKHPGQWLGGDVRALIRRLRHQQYTHIIDAQGLLKSALVAGLGRGRRYGYGFGSIRERMAALVYSHRISVDRNSHAVARVRQLFAAALDYTCPDAPPEYGVDVGRFPGGGDIPSPYLVFAHASTWPSKLWPVAHWRRLAALATGSGFNVGLPWASNAEREQAQSIADGQTHAVLLPRLGLSNMAAVMSRAEAAVAVDTGLGHLAAAVGTPGLSIYGATNPALTGTVGTGQHHLSASFPCSPCLRRRCTYTEAAAVTPACYSTVSPQRVWDTLRLFLGGAKQ